MNTYPMPHFQRFLHLLRCPACGCPLETGEETLKCNEKAHTFPIANGIPQLFVPHDRDPAKEDVTDEVRQFYERTPFPNYDEFDSIEALMQKSRKGRFARLLDEQVPLRSKVLEVGCGTGQWLARLEACGHGVVGVDPSELAGVVVVAPGHVDHARTVDGTRANSCSAF